MRRTTLILTALFLCIFAAQAAAMSPLEYYRLARKHDGSIHPFAAMVQSAHETGYWTSWLWTNARNGAGLKADKAWLADGKPTVSKNSQESSGGSYYSVNSTFRKYRTTNHFLADYSLKIRKDYPLCREKRKNIWGYFAGLYEGRRGKWATDHAYYDKLVAKAIKLAPEIYRDRWKKKLVKDYKVAVIGGLVTGWQKDILTRELRSAGLISSGYGD